MWRFLFLLLLLGGFGVHGYRWRVDTFTANTANAGTDSGIFITLFGTDGNSEEIELDNINNNFERGDIDTFYINTPNIGELCRVRIRSDGLLLAHGWKLEKIQIVPEVPGRLINFSCNCWLDSDDDHLEETLKNNDYPFSKVIRGRCIL